MKHTKVEAYGWLVCALAAFFYCYEFLLRIQPSVMQPQLLHNFHITAQGLGLLSAAYYWAYTPLQAVVGVIIDYVGSRRVLLCAIALCVVGSFVFGMTHSVYVAGVGRLLIGIGSAFAFIGVLKLASIWLPHNRFALFVGITTALGMLGAMLGDINMAWIVEHYGWHRVVVLGALLGTLLIPLFLLFVYEPRAMEDNNSIEHRLSFRQTLNGLLMVFKNRQILLAGAIGCLLYLSLSAFAELWGVAFLQLGTHSGVVRAAEINSMVFLGWLIGSPFHGFLSDYLESRRLQLITGSVLAAASISLILMFPGMNQYGLFLLLFLFGFFASAEILCFAVARDITPLRSVGMAMAAVNFLVMLGGMVFQPMVGWLLVTFFGAGDYTVMAYRVALAFIPCSMLLAAGLSCCLGETYRDGE